MTLWASWGDERVGGMPSRETPLSARQGEDQVRVLGLTTSIPSSTATSSLLIKGAMEPVRDEHRGFYSNLFLVKKQDGGSDLSSTKGPELVYKEKTFVMATLKDISQSIRKGDLAATM